MALGRNGEFVELLYFCGAFLWGEMDCFYSLLIAYDKETLLTPLLFVVVMEALSGMLSATVDSWLFSVVFGGVEEF